MASANVELVRDSLDAWNRGDVDDWLHGSHPHVEWTSEIAQAIEGSQRVYRGREGLRQFWDEWRGVWTLTIEVSEFRERGEDGLVRRARAYFDVGRGLESAGLT